MRSASGLITLSKWQHKPTFANVSQSATNNLAIPVKTIANNQGDIIAAFAADLLVGDRRGFT